ncbi:hypothetical protein MBLNU459_g1948t1 [Dothideomycetes sp. NU459]
MRLAPELVQNSLSYLNPLNERELDLRGHKIPVLENLGLIRDQDAIDFTDNDIALLGNFPLNPRLQALYLGRNRVGSIASGLAKSIPNVHTVVLTQNQLSELADLEPLLELPKLVYLSLLENPVTSKENYRYWVISRCPSLRILDFSKIKDSERTKATELFGRRAEPTEIAQQVLSIRSHKSVTMSTGAQSGVNGANGGKNYRVKLTDNEKKRFEELIKNAKTLAEVARLEKDLNEGRIPAGLMDG